MQVQIGIFCCFFIFLSNWNRPRTSMHLLFQLGNHLPGQVELFGQLLQIGFFHKVLLIGDNQRGQVNL